MTLGLGGGDPVLKFVAFIDQQLFRNPLFAIIQFVKLVPGIVSYYQTGSVSRHLLVAASSIAFLVTMAKGSTYNPIFATANFSANIIAWSILSFIFLALVAFVLFQDNEISSEELNSFLSSQISASVGIFIFLLSPIFHDHHNVVVKVVMLICLGVRANLYPMNSLFRISRISIFSSILLLFYWLSSIPILIYLLAGAGLVDSRLILMALVVALAFGVIVTVLKSFRRKHLFSRVNLASALLMNLFALWILFGWAHNG